VVLNDGSPIPFSSRGVDTAPDISFVPSAREQHLTWRTGTHIGSDHLPIIVAAHCGSHINQPRRKAMFSYKKADWPTFQETLDLSLSQWKDCPHPTSTTRKLCYSQPLLLQPRKNVGKDPKGSWKTQCAWWCPEVEQAVIRRCQAQEDLQAHTDDDDKVRSFQLASSEAQEATEDAKARLWQEFVTDSRGVDLDGRTICRDLERYQSHRWQNTVRSILISDLFG